MQNNIWHALTIDNVLNTVEATLGQKLTNLFLQRNSYINRVFELELQATKERLIVKFYRPQRWTRAMILTELDLLQRLAAAEIAVIPPLSLHGQVLFDYAGLYFVIFPKKGGQALDELNKEQWLQIGRLLGRVHSVSKQIKQPQRILWRPLLATTAHLQVLKETAVLPPDYAASFFATANQLIKKYDPLFTQNELILLHGDCHLGNLIFRPGEGLFILDFDDMCLGPVAQDLWLLLPDLPENCANEIDWFLTGYETFLAFPQAELALIPALRAMRLIHFASWCAVQKSDPGFTNHFPEWGSPKYWNETLRSLQSLL